MDYSCDFISPIGRIFIESDGSAVTALYFSEEKKCGSDCGSLTLAKKWLDMYFSGKAPDFIPPIKTCGTPFREVVWKLLSEIPIGTTVTYGEIAKKAAGIIGKSKMSAQAVGGAVGHNPIGIIIPCHRVIGADGSMTGYGFGIDRKIFLLSHEQKML